MSKKPETIFKERVHRDLREIQKATQALWFVKTQQVSIRGTPDELLCVRGKFIAIELKATEKDFCDPLQLRTLDLIHAASGLAMCAHPGNWDLILPCLWKLAQGQRVGPVMESMLLSTLDPSRQHVKRLLLKQS
jgi:hypothetical protein